MDILLQEKEGQRDSAKTSEFGLEESEAQNEK
jgi:hypothetical protein